MRIKIYFLKVKKLKANERRLLGAAYFPRVCETKDVWLFPVDQMGTVHKRAGVVLDPVQESHLEPQKDHDKEARGLLSSWGMRELSWALLQNLDAHVRETVPFLSSEKSKINVGRKNRSRRLERNRQQPVLCSVHTWSLLVLPQDGKHSLLPLKLSNPMDFCKQQLIDNFWLSHKGVRVFTIKCTLKLFFN